MFFASFRNICEEFGVTDTTDTTDTADTAYTADTTNNVENVVNGEDTRKRP